MARGLKLTDTDTPTLRERDLRMERYQSWPDISPLHVSVHPLKPSHR